jgi:S-adenosylmethionine:tRNA ribosyltransferase-isomerase
MMTTKKTTTTTTPPPTTTTTTTTTKNEIRPATAPRNSKEHRVLVVDGATGETKIVSALDVASLFEPGDLLVVNDAATLPASLYGCVAGESANAVELRLVSHIGDLEWTVALLGDGDWHTKTEDRALPPHLRVGDAVQIGEEDGKEGLRAVVLRVHDNVSARLVDVAFAAPGEHADPVAATWAAMYRLGRPVQYAHVPEPLALWDIQNVYAGRPWAVEMPSAGKMIRASTILELMERGVEIARVTHAAGLSSIGDDAVDALLPLPERFEVTEATWEAIARTRKRNGRVIALGTSAARALEGGARAGGQHTGITDFRLGPNTRRAVVDAIVTGVHDAETSHYTLLGAFASASVLEKALSIAATAGLLGHEWGDACLVWGEPREKVSTRIGELVDKSNPSSSLRNGGVVRQHAAA